MYSLLIPILALIQPAFSSHPPKPIERCPDLSGSYRIPRNTECKWRDGLRLTLPLPASKTDGGLIFSDGVSGEAGDTLVISQTGCRELALTLQNYTQDFQIPSELEPNQTANQAFRKVSWVNKNIFGGLDLEIEHSYPSPAYVGGILNSPHGRVWKTWLLSRKKNGNLDLFSRLDYSSFHKPYAIGCELKRY